MIHIYSFGLLFIRSFLFESRSGNFEIFTTGTKFSHLLLWDFKQQFLSYKFPKIMKTKGRNKLKIIIKIFLSTRKINHAPRITYEHFPTRRG